MGKSNRRNQEQTVFNSILVTSGTRTETIYIDEDVESATILVTTDSAYVGTTGTLTLTGSLDGTTFATVFQDDNTTAVSFTLAASSNYQILLKRVLFKYYRVIFTVGNASAGTITGTFLGKRY